jgi:hypothetical protein
VELSARREPIYTSVYVTLIGTEEYNSNNVTLHYLTCVVIVITPCMQVMELIMTREGKQSEAALCVASQIGYVIPKYCAQVLESADTNSAAVLVEKLFAYSQLHQGTMS